MRSSTSLSMVVGVFVLCASPVFAQYTTASFSGTVVDSNNAVLPESQVIVRNVGTGFTQTATTDQSGAFLFPRLPVGSYELRVEKLGFATYVQTGITLTVESSGKPDGRHAGRPGHRGGDGRSGCRAHHVTERHAEPTRRSKADRRAAAERTAGAVAGVPGGRDSGPRDATAAAFAATAACTRASRRPA